MKTAVSMEDIIKGASFYLLVSESIRLRRLQAHYREELEGLEEGECLVAYCEFDRKEPEVVVVEDFVHFCNLVDAVWDVYHPMRDIDFFRRSIKYEADAAT